MSYYNTPPYSGDEYSAPTARTISITEVNSLTSTLRSRRVNTLTELRRIERTLSSLPHFMSDICPTMSEAWNNYVSSNNFLNELRGLTRNYPFSAELLEDAKSRVYNDPNSTRSWNYVWLLLVKITSDGLVLEWANRAAYNPIQWGGLVPDPTDAQELAQVLAHEWDHAVQRLLRHWTHPPTIDGRW